jgi:hypothetical protein
LRALQGTLLENLAILKATPTRSGRQYGKHEESSLLPLVDRVIDERMID